MRLSLIAKSATLLFTLLTGAQAMAFSFCVDAGGTELCSWSGFNYSCDDLNASTSAFGSLAAGESVDSAEIYNNVTGIATTAAHVTSDSVVLMSWAANFDFTFEADTTYHLRVRTGQDSVWHDGDDFGCY